MKLIVTLLLLSAPHALAAFAAATAWDVRTTGNAANGGGFNVAATGTDRSQRDTPYITYTDIIIGGTTTQGTSVLNPFDSTSPGNIVNIVSGAGCTVQRAQVVSVAGSTATFDKSLGTGASVCAGNYGGGLLTIVGAIALAVTTNSVHIKSGTYNNSAAIIAVGVGIYLKFIGYGTTHNDGGTKPIITTATNTQNIFEINEPCVFNNLTFTNTAAGVRYAAVSINSTQGAAHMINVLGDGNGVVLNSSATNAQRPSFVINSEFKNGSYGISYSGNVYVYGSYIHDNSVTGISILQNDLIKISAAVTRSILSANAVGIEIPTNGSVFLNETVVANSTSHGISMTAPTALVMNNSVISGNGGWGITSTAVPWVNVLYNNGYGTNTSGNLNNITAGTGDVTLSASPFTSSTNFALNATAGGGAALKQLGFPGAFPGGTTTGYLDIGAVNGTGGSVPATLAYPSVQ